MWTALVVNLLTLIGFFLFVSSLLAMHTYLISRSLTTCKLHSSLSYRGVPLVDEDFLSQSLAQEVRLAFLSWQCESQRAHVLPTLTRPLLGALEDAQDTPQAVN